MIKGAPTVLSAIFTYVCGRVMFSSCVYVHCVSIQAVTMT